jgi:hypothetical protein
MGGVLFYYCENTLFSSIFNNEILLENIIYYNVFHNNV